jgi:predicted nucleic acid-binding protein
MAHLWRTRSGRLSYQVLQEYYVTVTKKLQPGLDREEARSDVRSLLAWRPMTVNRQTVELAWLLQDRYQISWWDALIAGSAQMLGCRYLLTEDLQEGMAIGDLRVVNPFRNSPTGLD